MPAKTRSHGAAGLDAIDLQILRLFRDEGRLPIKTLASKVHISRANAYSRLERLEQGGVIRQFTAMVDPARVGFGVGAVLLVSTAGEPSGRGGSDLLKEVPGIEYAAWVTGEVDLVLIVRAKDMDELRDSIVWRLRRNPHVHATRTLLVFQESVHRPFLLPADSSAGA